MANEKEFAGQGVVISGGSRGIGRGIAEAFAAQGAQTVPAASSQATLESTADAIEQRGGLRPDVFAADLRTEEGCRVVFKLVSDRYGRCDILVKRHGDRCRWRRNARRLLIAP